MKFIFYSPKSKITICLRGFTNCKGVTSSVHRPSHRVRKNLLSKEQNALKLQQWQSISWSTTDQHWLLCLLCQQLWPLMFHNIKGQLHEMTSSIEAVGRTCLSSHDEFRTVLNWQNGYRKFYTNTNKLCIAAAVNHSLNLWDFPRLMSTHCSVLL